VRLGDGLVGELACHDVDPFLQSRVRGDRRGQAVVRDRLDVRGSAATAAARPLFAIASTYGRVAFVSAFVDVTGTAPGMFATQ
jgi:hypothetical protein